MHESPRPWPGERTCRFGGPSSTRFPPFWQPGQQIPVTLVAWNSGLCCQVSEAVLLFWFHIACTVTQKVITGKKPRQTRGFTLHDFLFSRFSVLDFCCNVWKQSLHMLCTTSCLLAAGSICSSVMSTNGSFLLTLLQEGNDCLTMSVTKFVSL